jgi:oligopeptide/dipeptide ABC transporter ATP-binding protein
VSQVTLRVDNLKVSYRTLRGEVQALDGVSFGVADGELVGLAGESGCGKSTLGKSLIRLDASMRHVDGTVELDGKELPIADDERMNGFRFKEVSIIPQYAMSALNPTRRIGRMLAELLESRGVRLAGVRDYVKSTLFITHDLSLVYQIADSIIVMYAGRLAEKAPTDALVAAPRHPYTRMLLAALPEVGVRYGARRLQGIPGSPPSLLDPPTGCRFRDRCPLAFDRCVEQPPFLEVAPDHFVACWKAV